MSYPELNEWMNQLNAHFHLFVKFDFPLYSPAHVTCCKTDRLGQVNKGDRARLIIEKMERRNIWNEM